jgi:hypothetical protein
MALEIRLPAFHELKLSPTGLLVLPVIEFVPSIEGNTPHVSHITYTITGNAADIVSQLQSVYQPFHSNSQTCILWERSLLI